MQSTSCSKLFFVAFLLSFFIFHDASAQIIGSNCYLQGNFVEVGINTCGAYGSNESPPAEYHETYPFTGLGFVADPGSDGWDVGDPDPYCGDYFVPGSPVEGWQIQIGASIYTNTDQSCGGADIPGSITDYYYAAGEYVGIWEGDIAASNMHIIQKTIVPENKVYFLTEITMCNEGVTDISNVYYKRNVDPDQDVALASDYNTTNVIEVNPPDTCTALVTATGGTIGCFLGMGALDTMARASYGLFNTDAASPLNAWNGTGGYTNTEGSSTFCDCATQITFKIPTIPAGECRTVTFAYILNIDDLIDALEATLPVDVLVNGEPAPADDTLYVCNFDAVDIDIAGGSSYDWTWTFEGGTGISADSSAVFTPSESISSVTMQGVGGFCGTLYRKLTIVYEGDITANAGDDQAICIGSSTNLEGSGGYTYLWSPSTGLADPSNPETGAEPTETTTYTLTAISQHGCPDTDMMTLTVNPLPIIDAGPDENLCPEGDIQLEASGAVDYSWSPSTGLSCDDCPDPVCTVDDNTTYTVTGTDENGCVNTAEINISVFSTLDITVTADPGTIDVYQGQTCQLEATGAESYLWTPSIGLSATDIPNPIANPTDTMTYYVTGIDENGCIDIDTITVNVIGELVIGLPTAFSPNGDGINDYWAPEYSGSGFLDSYLIYNRWGELVYEGNATSKGWDGTVKNEPQGIGTFTVVIQAHTTKNEDKLIPGNFILVR